MEQQTVTIKNFSRIENPDIHYRRMTYPPEREILLVQALDMILNSIQKRNDALLQGVKLKLHCQIENLYATTIKELLTELLVQPQQNLIIKE